MRTSDLLLRCYAERLNGQWQAFCIDLSLGAQGESLDEVTSKLDSQIREYLEDALVGQDREHARYLIQRKAPLSLRLRYHYVAIRMHLNALSKRRFRVFDKPMPLVPAPA